MATTVWRGSNEVQLAPDGIDWDFGALTKCTLTYHGPYDKCLANRPTRGQQLDGYDPALTVENAKLKRQAGGRGILTIFLSGDDASTISGADTPQVKYEIEWVSNERKLEQHTRYQAGGDKALTPTDLAALKAWEDEADAVKRAAYKYTDTSGAEQTLSANAQDLAAKKLRAQDSFLFFNPVARKTSATRASPATSACAKRETPTGFALPTGYVWLKTADRASRTGKSGKWERVEEWTGADVWDTDIYESA